MAQKKKRNDFEVAHSQEPSVVDPGRQPRVLGWLVLIAGTASTWYWYRPLPTAVTETANSTQSSEWAVNQSGPKSIWTDEGLIVPSLRDSNSPPAFAPPLPQREAPELVGTPGVVLTPWTEPKQDIREMLKTEKLPLVPVKPENTNSSNLSGSNLPQLSAPGLPAWTPENSGSMSTSSPKLIDRTSPWPDAGYVPETVKQRAALKAATKITSQIPPLLETGMRSIRTGESAEDGTSSQPKLTDEHSKSLGANETQSQANARQPSFIRQPKK